MDGEIGKGERREVTDLAESSSDAPVEEKDEREGNDVVEESVA